MKDRLLLVGLAWVAAFLIVMTIFMLFGDGVARLPLAVRALIISGVLSISMTLVVGPAIANQLQRQAGRSDREPPT
jgi:antibiotic biosynthesis monooxygenase (ABM) superfamily enzyme